MEQKYVRDMNPSELRAHMRRLKAMPGWHEPLADSLYAEIQRMDAEATLTPPRQMVADSAGGAQTEKRAHVIACVNSWLRDAGLPLYAATPSAAREAMDEPDMFWNHDDPERCQDSVHNVVIEAYENGSNVGDIVEVQQAIRLHKIKVRIIADAEDSEEISYEPVEDAAELERPTQAPEKS